jgi:hypothetical protein
MIRISVPIPMYMSPPVSWTPMPTRAVTPTNLAPTLKRSTAETNGARSRRGGGPRTRAGAPVPDVQRCTFYVEPFRAASHIQPPVEHPDGAGECHHCIPRNQGEQRGTGLLTPEHHVVHALHACRGGNGVGDGPDEGGQSFE